MAVTLVWSLLGLCSNSNSLEQFFTDLRACQGWSCTATHVCGAEEWSVGKLMTDIAVVVTCHEPYLKWLPETVASIDWQAPAPAERVVVFDSCDPLPLDEHWSCVTGDWRHVCPARNTGAATTHTPWVIFWDADNVMPAGYIAAVQQAIDAASADCAIIYPDLQYCFEGSETSALLSMPEWNYWELRVQNFVDTASAWRRDAFDLAGGWPDRTGGDFADHALALDITAQGWKAMKLTGPPVIMRAHSGSMTASTRSGSMLTTLWKARSLAVVTILSGHDERLARWTNFLLNAELPAKTALYVVDNGGSPDFTEMVYKAGQHIAEARALTHLDVVGQHPFRGRTVSTASFTKGHQFHSAPFYATLLPRVAEDLVLTLEDNLTPPYDAPARLGEQISLGVLERVGVVAAAYPMAQDLTHVSAGRESGAGKAGLRWHDLPAETLDVDWAGGACTVWANWALRGNPIRVLPGADDTWDTALCSAVRDRGYSIKVHGAVRCTRQL